MNAFTLTDEPPVPAFLCRAMQQSRIPCERHGNSTPIGEINNHSIVSNVNALYYDPLCFNP